MKKNCFILLIILLSGCAKGRLDVYGKDGKIVGECIAGYDWHFYGVHDSVNYMLNICAQQAIAEGFEIKDDTILNTDFTLPAPPEGQNWNRYLAMKEFKNGEITEQELGFVLSEIEHQYALKERSAEEQLANRTISQQEFERIIKDAKHIWYGQ